MRQSLPAKPQKLRQRFSEEQRPTSRIPHPALASELRDSTLWWSSSLRVLCTAAGRTALLALPVQLLTGSARLYGVSTPPPGVPSCAPHVYLSVPSAGTLPGTWVAPLRVGGG